jgi:hypothetical protein
VTVDAYILGHLLRDGGDLADVLDAAQESGRFGRRRLRAQLRVARALLELIDHGHVRLQRGRLDLIAEARA